jgi:hypothetical protein
MSDLNETKQRLNNIDALDEQKHHETHDCRVSISDHGDRFNIKSAPSNFYLFRVMTETRFHVLEILIGCPTTF